MNIELILSIFTEKCKSIFNNNSVLSTIMQSKIDSKSTIRAKTRVYNSTIGEYTFIQRNCLIQRTKIGKFCSISEGCFIGLPEHRYDLLSTSPVFTKGKNYLNTSLCDFDALELKETIIENDVWIGTHVLIKGGIHVGNGAIIGAGSVVTKDVPDYAIVGGNPARIIKYRFDKDKIDSLLKLK